MLPPVTVAGATATATGAATAGTAGAAGTPDMKATARFLEHVGRTIQENIQDKADTIGLLMSAIQKLPQVFSQEEPTCTQGCPEDPEKEAERKNTESVDKATAEAKEKTDARFADALDEDHHEAAELEQNGGSVGNNPKTGKPWDHVTEVKDAQRGLQNDIEKLERKIKWARTWAEPEPEKESISRAQRQLEEMKRILNESRRRVP